MASSRAAPSLLSGAAGAGAGATGDINDLLGAGGGSAWARAVRAEAARLLAAACRVAHWVAAVWRTAATPAAMRP